MRAEGRNPRRLTSTFGLLTSDTRTGAVAQLGEHLLCKQGVVGSIPISSTRRDRASQLSRNGSCFYRVIVHPRRRSRPRESAVSTVETTELSADLRDRKFLDN